MKARIHRYYDGPLVPYYNKTMARLGARLCGTEHEHWAEAEIKSIDELMQIVSKTNYPVIVGWDNAEKTCVEVTICDDHGAW